jgi:hypothetical protein
MFDQIKTIFLLFTRDRLKMLLLRKPQEHIVNIIQKCVKFKKSAYK